MSIQSKTTSRKGHLAFLGIKIVEIINYKNRSWKIQGQIQLDPAFCGNKFTLEHSDKCAARTVNCNLHGKGGHLVKSGNLAKQQIDNIASDEDEDETTKLKKLRQRAKFFSAQNSRSAS